MYLGSSRVPDNIEVKLLVPRTLLFFSLYLSTTLRVKNSIEKSGNNILDNIRIQFNELYF